jgi:hypothetical protein
MKFHALALWTCELCEIEARGSFPRWIPDAGKRIRSSEPVSINPQLQFFPDTPLKCEVRQPLLRCQEADHVNRTDHNELPEPASGAQAVILSV